MGSTTLQNSLFGLTKETSGAGTSYFARTPEGMLIDERTPRVASTRSTTRRVTSSHWSTRARAKSTGTFHYGPYGENVKSEGTQTIPYPFGYKGGYRMPGGNTGKGNVANGLLHFGQRYYDPTVGRWTQRDPLNQVASFNRADRFLFAGSSPINNSDPGGTELLEEGLEFIEEVGQAATKESTGIPIPTRRQFETAVRCGSELGKKGDFEYETGQYRRDQGSCDPFEYLPGGEVEEAQ